MEEQELKIQEQQAMISRCEKELSGLNMNVVDGEAPLVPIFEDERELAKYKDHEVLQLKRSVEETEGKQHQLIISPTWLTKSQPRSH